MQAYPWKSSPAESKIQHSKCLKLCRQICEWKNISNSILNKKNFNKMLSSTDHRWKAWRGKAHLLIQIKRQHLLGPLNRSHNSCSYWTPQAKMTTAYFNCKEAATVEGQTKWSERPQLQTKTTVANPPPSLRSWFITALSKLMLCFSVWISKLT